MTLAMLFSAFPMFDVSTIGLILLGLIFALVLLRARPRTSTHCEGCGGLLPCIECSAGHEDHDGQTVAH